MKQNDIVIYLIFPTQFSPHSVHT